MNKKPLFVLAHREEPTEGEVIKRIEAIALISAITVCKPQRRQFSPSPPRLQRPAESTRPDHIAVKAHLIEQGSVSPKLTGHAAFFRYICVNLLRAPLDTALPIGEVR